MIEKLINLANELDELQLKKEADLIDNLIKKAQQRPKKHKKPFFPSPKVLRDPPNYGNEMWDEKQALPPLIPPPAVPQITKFPEIDADQCGRSIKYPEEAIKLNIEGEVVLRVGLDEKGSVISVRIVKGLGHGLDQTAINAIKSQNCKFTPALDQNGNPVPYELTYTFNFELPR